MNNKIKSITLFICGIAILIAGISMSSATKSWDEIKETEVATQGTKTENAYKGAAAGAVGGGVLAYLVGGVGIVVAGTGIGLPAGAALMGVAATMGAATGALVGAATGSSDSSAAHTEVIHHIVPAFETWQWASLIVIAGILMLLGVLQFRKSRVADKVSEGTTEQADGLCGNDIAAKSALTDARTSII